MLRILQVDPLAINALLERAACIDQGQLPVNKGRSGGIPGRAWRRWRPPFNVACLCEQKSTLPVGTSARFGVASLANSSTASRSLVAATQNAICDHSANSWPFKKSSTWGKSWPKTWLTARPLPLKGASLLQGVAGSAWAQGLLLVPLHLEQWRLAGSASDWLAWHPPALQTSRGRVQVARENLEARAGCRQLTRATSDFDCHVARGQ